MRALTSSRHATSPSLGHCPFKCNREQSDADADGIGDACDNCTGVKDATQRDADQDGAGDVCDVCPSNPHFQGNAADGSAPPCTARVTTWLDYEDRERRSHLAAFFRPSILTHIPLSSADPSDVEVDAGFHLTLTGSFDRWQLLPNHVALPPAWFFHIGAYASVTDFTDNPPRFGPIAGVDWRPLGNDAYAGSFLKNLRFGVQAHYLTGRPSDEGGEWVKRLGTGLKVSFLDIVSIAPAVQLDLGDDLRTSLGIFALFDFKYLDDLGVSDVLKRPAP